MIDNKQIQRGCVPLFNSLDWVGDPYMEPNPEILFVSLHLLLSGHEPRTQESTEY